MDDKELAQVHMSGASAAEFAFNNWPHYQVHCLMRFGEIPISKETMRQHANALLDMVDLDDLPEG